MIKVILDLLVFHYKCEKENIFIMPKWISISDKSILFDGCPTAKLGKKLASSPVCVCLIIL